MAIPLTCSDPAPENSSVDEEIVTQPANGDLGSVSGGNPAQVIYTPKTNFKGTDSFTFNGDDGNSEGLPATITVTVMGPAPTPGGGGGGGTGGGGGGPGTLPPDTRKPTIVSLQVSPKRFKRSLRLPTFSALAKTGTVITFRVDEAVKATFTFAQALPGRRSGARSCGPPARTCAAPSARGTSTAARSPGR